MDAPDKIYDLLHVLMNIVKICKTHSSVLCCDLTTRYFCFVTFPFAVLGSIPNYTVWLESPLRVEFNSSKNCTYYHLFRQGIKVNATRNVTPEDSYNFVTFTISSVSIEFNNVTMTVQAEDSSGQQVYRTFFIYTQGLNNSVMLHSSTCIIMYI